jgi:prepilin-type processing-associated H-X9-DG protein
MELALMTDTHISMGDIGDVARSDDLSTLVVTLKSGGRAHVSAEKLRLSCKCAHCLRARIDEHFPEAFPGIAIVGLGHMGYGFNIAFSDGHSRGIYPLGYIASLLEF